MEPFFDHAAEELVLSDATAEYDQLRVDHRAEKHRQAGDVVRVTTNGNEGGIDAPARDIEELLG